MAGIATISVALSRGFEAIVDECDAHILKHSWCAVTDNNTEYAFTNLLVNGRKRPVSMHRMLLCLPASRVDHIDGNGLNNTRGNIRLATGSQNQFNRRKRTSKGTSRFKGVGQHGTRWRASISLGNGQQRWQAMFVSEETAARAYDIKAVEWFGEFACINFPDSIEQSRIVVAEAMVSDKWTTLNPDLVRNIRRLKASGLGATAIAARICVNVKTVGSVIEGRSWKHIPAESPALHLQESAQ